MSERNEDLYETRTNLLSCDNMVDYFWRRCDHISYPFKPAKAVDVKTSEVSHDKMLGKDIFQTYAVDSQDKKNSLIKTGHEYNFDIVDFETTAYDKSVVTKGYLALIYKPDRKWYCLFFMENPDTSSRSLRLVMTVKQKVTLFGSFENEMITYY